MQARPGSSSIPATIGNRNMQKILRLLNYLFRNFTYSYFFNDWIFSLSRFVGNKAQRWTLLEELRASQYLPEAFLADMQRRNLLQLLASAAQRSSFWRDRLRRHDIDLENFKELDDIKRLPVTDKSFYREMLNVKAETAKSPYLWASYNTTGTSGDPFYFFLDELSIFWRYLFILRGNSWAGAQETDVFVRAYRRGYPDPVYFFCKNEAIFLEWNKKDIGLAKIRQLRGKGPLLWYGFIEYFRMLAEQWRQLEPMPVRAVIVTGEQLLEGERSSFEKIFNAPVYISYSSREFGRIAQECERKEGLHVNAERFLIEIIDERGAEVPFGTHGRIIITDTKNSIMPFIRYDIGDWGSLSKEPCSCGKTLPLLFVKNRNFKIAQGGRFLNPMTLFAILERAGKNIMRYQVIQREENIFDILIRPLPSFSKIEEDEIKNKIEEVLGSDAKINIVTQNPSFMTQNGKQPAYISLVR